MEIVKIDQSNEALFYRYVRGRDLEFFFYLMDYKQYPENTQLFMAIDEDQSIQGLFIIWSHSTIQLRGSEQAASEFLRYLDKNGIAIECITGTVEHQKILEPKFSDFTHQFRMYRMTLSKGEEQLKESHSYSLLGPEYAEQIAAFLRRVDPIYWGDEQADDVLIDENRPFLAIMEKDNIISIAGLWVDEDMGIINIIGTDPDYRNQGFATSMVSSGVKYLFARTSQILIHVRVENKPAVSIYKKIGYKPEFEYIVYKKK